MASSMTESQLHSTTLRLIEGSKRLNAYQLRCLATLETEEAWERAWDQFSTKKVLHQATEARIAAAEAADEAFHTYDEELWPAGFSEDVYLDAISAFDAVAVLVELNVLGLVDADLLNKILLPYLEIVDNPVEPRARDRSWGPDRADGILYG